MDILEDRFGSRDGIRELMRERLNAKGDRVMLRECDARMIIENTDALVDMLRRAHDDLAALRKDNEIANHAD